MIIITREKGPLQACGDEVFLPYVPQENVSENNVPQYLQLENHIYPDHLADVLSQIKAIELCFPTFNDGRAFSQARQLRHMGFQGRLRASGQVIPDQWKLILQSGFDELVLDSQFFQRTGLSAWQKVWHQNPWDYRHVLTGQKRPQESFKKGQTT